VIEFCAVASNRMKWYRDGGVRAMVAVLVLGLVFPPLWWGGVAHLRTKTVGLAILSVFFASLATVAASTALYSLPFSPFIATEHRLDVQTKTPIRFRTLIFNSQSFGLRILCCGCIFNRCCLSRNCRFCVWSADRDHRKTFLINSQPHIQN
jgi:hypothetical protein